MPKLDAMKEHQIIENGAICVAGGGRWAKIIVETLASHLLPADQPIFIQSIHSRALLEEWLAKVEFNNRLFVVDTVPEDVTTLIVANAARLHYQTVADNLKPGRFVLVEKPIVQSTRLLNQLIEQAEACNSRLAAGHVFSFANYIDNFAALLPTPNNDDLAAHADSISNVKLIWTDNFDESATIAEKAYDPHLPVYADWLPHVFSVLAKFLNLDQIELRNLDISKGGAAVTIEFAASSTPVQVQLDRSSPARNRHIQVKTLSGKTHCLDFTQEPGKIESGGASVNAQPDWQQTRKPLSTMLSAFLEWAQRDTYEQRFDLAFAQTVVGSIEACQKLYDIEQGEWLGDQLELDVDATNKSLRYAMQERMNRFGELALP